MVNHPNRARPQKWAQYLPEIGSPVLAKIKRVQELEAQAAALRKEVMFDICNLWTPFEIAEARAAANAGCMTKAF